MYYSKRLLTLLSLLLVSAFILGACTTPTPEKIIETVVQEVIKTEVVIEEKIVVVTPTQAPKPQGGTIITSSFADANILNPILSSDSASSDIHSKLYLGLVGTDEFSGETIGEFAKDWDVSDDGLVYTFYLRDDIVWSDGTPMTAKDYKFTYDAIASDLVETPRKSNIELVDSIEVVDDYTVKVTFSENDCTALPNLGLGILPSHKFAEDFSDIMDSPENEAPSVSVGPFIFKEWVKDDHITLVSNPDYYLGAPNVEGWIYRILADTSAEMAALLAGEIDVTGVGSQYVSTIEGAIASGMPLQMKKFFDDGYGWIGMNQANPENPQNGFEDLNENEEYDEGEPVLIQDPHPILGDVKVRQAISHAIDYVNIVNKVIFGQGVQTASNILPAVEWAFDADLAPYPYDLEKAAAILEEAGWVDTDEDGIREKDGMTLSLKLQTNAGNESRENIIVLVQESLNSIGFDIDAENTEWGTYLGDLLGQTYDMAMLGWTGKGTDPDDVGLWEYRFDTVGSGFNFSSYYNPSMEELGQKGKTLPGCDPAERGPIYKEIGKMLHDDAPYAFLYVPLGNVIWNTRINAIDPGPWSTYYNVEQWYITP